MATVELSEESLEIAKQEAIAPGIEPSVLIERAIMEVRLRRELQKGHDSILAGRVKPLDLNAIMAAAKNRIEQGA